MNRIIDFVKQRFSKYSMKTKLIVSFSVTIAAIFLLVMLVLNTFIGQSYRDKIIGLSNQSFSQAKSFLGNYIDNMYYASDLIYLNGDLQRVLSSSNFGNYENEAEQYREFLMLDNVFSTIERNESIYQTRIYLPDDIGYTNNFIHFYTYSQLESREDYEEFARIDASEIVYITDPEVVYYPGVSHPVELVSLLRTIRATDGSNRVLAVLQVSIRTSDMKSVIDKSNITKNGLVYLRNEKTGELVSSSATGGELLEALTENNAFPDFESDSGQVTMELQDKKYIINQSKLIQTNWRLVALVPESEITEQQTQITAIVIVIATLAIAVIVYVSFWLARYYTVRLDKLAKLMDLVKNGHRDIDYGEPSGDEIGRLFTNFEYMTNELDSLMAKEYESGKQIKSAELKALQAQINPHFLYNTLDLINWEAIDHNVPQIAEVAKNLARFYRISLNRGGPIVTVEEEVSHVKAYVDIENRHFDDAIVLTTDIKEEVKQLACMNIILQPFVENSIMHGIAEDTGLEECNIHLQAYLEGEKLVFVITDDGFGIEEEKLEQILSLDLSKGDGYGIKNINSRIKLCYGEEYGVSIESEEGQGTKVTITTPALSVEEAKKKI